ncbi:holo-[acyl-carrier-protein] synthase [Maudiozyma exigua]|uniref:holo-[acyl-carrier-protein] synthase n=1 Tax=Maudiozyma exigua TaxID=34358 RepID=A0A9P7B7W0_MAUEX|nr:holo-[acyl-carrier-protein] synthase [Kazachstania exigua]
MGMNEFLKDTLQPGALDVCIVLDIDSKILNDEFEFEMAMRVLPIKWRNKVMCKKTGSDRKKALCNRLLQLVGCSVACNIPVESLNFDTIQNGKPLLIDQDKSNGIVTFSMTNGKHFVAIYLKRSTLDAHVTYDVGIDLASVADLEDPINLELYRDIFNPIEYESLQSNVGMELKRLFAYYWSFKESYTKYTGTGISCDLKAINAGRLENFENAERIERLIDHLPMIFHSTWLNHTYPEIITTCQPKALHNESPKLYRISVSDILSYLKQ